MRYKRYWLSALVFIGVVSCGKEVLEHFSGFVNPAGFPEPTYHFATNNVTKAGFELGRKIFYEPRLSRNNTISCGSCHIQSSAFTQHGHDVSHGIDDLLGSRNSPPIMNLAWMPGYFWDGGVFDLDLQPIVPITNHVEMDESVENVLVKLRAMPVYTAMFREAFGTEEITSARMMRALSQFMLMCISSESKYDSVLRNQAVFTTVEETGRGIFEVKCSQCHSGILFTDHSFRNNGIGIGLNDDPGRFAITLNPGDRYRFKVPSLRNVEFTGPYMHDGRLITLDAVLEHYNSGVQATTNLDPLLQENGRLGIALTGQDKTALIAFLKTLSDRHFITNPLLAEQ